LEKIEMVRKSLFLLGLFFLVLFLSGCPKRVPEPLVIEKLPPENPITRFLAAFSPAESLQAKASIRIETVRKGEEMNFPLNGVILFQRPDRFRILGYHPLGMGLFDAIYKNGEFFLLIPVQKRAYVGEVSQFEDLMEREGAIQISVEKSQTTEIPSRIRIEVPEKETRIDVRLRDILLNTSLPEDSFRWMIPEDVEVRPITRLLKGKKLY
jgi:outer membrane lipoprotein-sorting protein